MKRSLLIVALAFAACSATTPPPPTSSLSEAQSAEIDRRVNEAMDLRYEALTIQFHQQFPQATRREVHIMVLDQMQREGPPNIRLDDIVPPAPALPPSLACTSYQIGQLGYTDCY